MFRAYCDESKEGDIFLVAGWVASDIVWAAFAEQWQAVLREEPAIPYFKHHDAKTTPPSGPFAGLTAEQVQEKLFRLVAVICNHEMYGVGTGMKTAVHDNAFKSSKLKARRLRQVFPLMHHYQTCLLSISAMIFQKQLEQGLDDSQVDFVFDQQDGLLAEFVEEYDAMKEQFPDETRAIAGQIIEADDKTCEALQAADFLAGQLTLNYRAGRSEDYYRQMVESHRILFTSAYMPSLDQIPELIHAFDALLTDAKAEKELEQVLRKLR